MAAARGRSTPGAKPAIRVFAADAQPLYRDAVVRVIRQQPRLELVGEAADGREALALIRDLRPDVAVLDLELPGLDGCRVLNAVTRDELPTRIIILSADLRAQSAYRAVAQGAGGYLCKEATAEELCRAICAVAAGETVLAPKVQTGIAGEIRSRSRDERPVLTHRERQVLGLIARGRSGPEIARELHLATATVKTHILHVYDKLEVSDRAAAVAVAMRRGLLE